MTVLLYVRRKGWPLESITVECSHERVHRRDADDPEGSDQTYIEKIKRHIVLEGELDNAQRERVAWIARRCPLHRTLKAAPHIEDEVDLVTR